MNPRKLMPWQILAVIFLGSCIGTALPGLLVGQRATAKIEALVAPSSPLVYNPVDFGAIGDGDPARCTTNTAAFQACFNAAAADPRPIYIPMSKGFAVLNGRLKLNNPNMVMYGCGGMGKVPDWASTSMIAGYGAGHTITVVEGGTSIRGLAWRQDSQTGTDSVIYVKETQVALDDMYFDGPNKGITVDWPYNVGGQFWCTNILMGGAIKSTCIDINAGGGAVYLDHIRTFNGDMQAGTRQPKYGVLVRSAGAFMMSHSDIDNCGCNLAIMPGIDGQANTYVQGVELSDSFYDNGNTDQICIRPFGSSFVINTTMTNIWTSSVNNGNGAWGGNGLTIDGTQSTTAVGFPCICSVSITGGTFQNNVGHCGIYANNVIGLSVMGIGAWNNFVGVQTYKCNGVVMNNRCGAYMPSAEGFPQVGNAFCGILLEKSPTMVFDPGHNALAGNRVPYQIRQ